MFDVPQTNIKKYFEISTNFIETALTNKGMKMFLICRKCKENNYPVSRKSSGSLSYGDV